MGNCCGKSADREDAYRVKSEAGGAQSGVGPPKKGKREAVQGIVDTALDSIVLPSIPKDDKVRDYIRQAMGTNLLFAMLDDEARNEIIDTMSKQTYPAGKVVILQGEKNAETFYAVESGCCEVLKNEEAAQIGSQVTESNIGQRISPPKLYPAGTGFGELALLYAAPRAASVRATETSVLWQMERSHYFLIKRKFVDKVNKEKLELLDSVPSFKSLNPRQLDLLIDALEPARISKGTQILRKGDTGDKFYIVKTGEVVIKIDGKEVCKQGPGSFFGERALIKDDVRAADVIATENCLCMTLNRQAFNDILGPLENLWRLEELRKVPMLCNLKEKQLALLAQEVVEVEYVAGQFVFRKGEQGDKLFIMEEGQCSVIDEDTGTELAVLTKGQYFGERGLMNSDVRAASIRCDTAVKVACLSRRVLHKCLGTLEDLLYAWRADTLANVDLLKVLSPGQRLQLAKNMEVEKFKDNEFIITRGESGDCFYIVESGEVVIIGNDGIKELVRLSPGKFFGEQALISNETRAASVRAIGPVQLLSVGRSAFNSVFGSLQSILDNASSSYEKDTSELKVELKDLEHLAVLGIGAFGKVLLVRHQGALFALKCMSKRQVLEKNMVNHVKREKEIMRALSSPFTVNLMATLHDEHTLYMLMEKVMGGEFFIYLQSREDACSEDEGRFYAACVIQAFEYMHGQGYMYRDLKPENLLIDSTGYLKVTDYGFAKKLVTGKSYTMCGTPEYLAPEIINQNGHGHAVDWWALGVLIFEMCTQDTPFGADDQMMILNNINGVTINWLSAKNLSVKCKDLMKKLLVKNPAKRLGSLKGGVNDIKNHPWFADFDWESLSNRTYKPPYVPHLDNPEDTSHFEDIPLDAKVPGEEEFPGSKARKLNTNAFVDW
ncbi:cGMP-dependent protein kinase [Cymbomonas tetramitiformis]|uniref:cGMP-dependent protein kinase n=1 Tax=Cymbomonas tetramitiformis TaxID=36881 RepID=A0AAE0F4W2_9CHLO|nr:cGMP-dependent protein kinase [Cymbomonas tetramitiformis]